MLRYTVGAARVFSFLALCACPLAAASATASAQTARSVVYAGNFAQSNPVRPLLQQSVSLNVKSVPLADALHRLVVSGVPLAYSTELVQGKGPVSCRCTRVPLGSALEQLTRNTGVGFREVSSGVILFFRKPRPLPRPRLDGAVAPGAIRGRVSRRDDGSAVSGATVQVVGTPRVGLSRSDGSYTVTGVPSGTHWVRVSSVGFQPDSQQVSVRDGETIEANFALVPSMVTLDPLEVTASTGTLVDTKLRALGTSIAIISQKEIERSGANDLFGLLQGTVAGVASFKSSAVNGSGGEIQIRGLSSILGDQAPLIYIDGVPVDNGSSAANRFGGDVIPHPTADDAATGAHTRLSDLSLDQIQRIEIVKGSAATTMYGSDAVNGVIQIFTKHGIPGGTRITAYTEQGISRVDLSDTFVRSSPFGDRLRSLFNDPRTQRYGLSVQGGAEKLTYTLGLTRRQDGGIVVGNGAQQTSGYASLSPDFGDKLTLRLSGNLESREYESLDYSTLFDFADSDGGNVASNLGIESMQEALARGSRSRTTVQRVIGTANLSWRPFDIWQTQLTLGIDRSNELEKRAGEPLRDPYSSDFEAENIRRDFNGTSARFVSSLSYPQSGAVTSTFSVGAEGRRNEIRKLRIRGTGLPSADVTRLDFAESLTSGAFAPIEEYSAIATVGVFAQEQVGLWDNLYLTGGIRADGSSAFGDNFGLQFYPKLAASYVITPTSWWTGKLRAAWGRSGKLPSPFAKVRTYSIGRGTFYNWPMITLDDYGNVDLEPELGTEIEFGVENYLWGNRLSLEANYWRQTTEHALLRGDLGLIYGFNGPLTNLADLRSAGVELVGHITPVQTANVRVRVGATMTHLIENGLVTNLGGVSERGRIGNLFLGLKEGQSLNAITYLALPTFDRMYFGSRVPTTYGGVTAGVEIGPVRLGSNFSYGFGGVALDHIRAQRDYAAGLITTPFRAFDPQVAEARYIVPTDYIRADAVRLSYEIPARFRGSLDRAEVWLEGRNLYTWDRWVNGDPTTMSPIGTAGGSAPLYLSGTLERGISAPHQYSIGVRVTF